MQGRPICHTLPVMRVNLVSGPALHVYKPHFVCQLGSPLHCGGLIFIPGSLVTANYFLETGTCRCGERQSGNTLQTTPYPRRSTTNQNDVTNMHGDRNRQVRTRQPRHTNAYRASSPLTLPTRSCDSYPTFPLWKATKCGSGSSP